MQSDDNSNVDRKSHRRDNINRKKTRPKDFDAHENRDQNKIKKAFKQRQKEIYQEELWEEWQDEIY